jgi:hypothetical protein
VKWQLLVPFLLLIMAAAASAADPVSDKYIVTEGREAVTA